MKIEQPAVEQPIVKKPSKKIDGFIWGLLIGMSIQLIIIGIVIRPMLPQLWWTATHREEVQWAMDRFTVIQKASHVLYFEDSMTGVTIVKPQSMQ